MQIKITEDGPYIVEGGVPLDEQIMVNGEQERIYEQRRTFEPGETYALCRCGHSKNPPFCDGAHVSTGFDGTETASREPFDERADVFEGPTLDLFDDGRCAYARFCHRGERDAWTLTEEADNPHLRYEAIKASWDCPTGRLVHHDKDAGYAPLEQEFEPSISILQDREYRTSGPLYVKGNIPLIGADGVQYELQNRYALCRCGFSSEKPFCDARHIRVRFRDGLDEKDPGEK